MFRIADGREHFYQWDLDRSIRVSDSSITEVHFCNRTGDCSLVVEVYANPTDSELYADVPNILLQTDWPINVYAYCGDKYTKVSTTFKVLPRTRPDDYVYTETEVKRWEDLEKRVDSKMSQMDEAEAGRNKKVDDKIAELDASETERVVAEQTRVAAEDERAAAEADRAETFSNLTNEAGVLIDVLDNYYVPTVDNHEIRITNMERHISGDYFLTDETTEYNKLVPVDACPYAEVDKVGGMTRKCNNLIPFPYYFTEPTTAFGVTWTPNADGSITANGTQTSSGSIGLFVNNTNPIFLNGTYSASLGATLPSGCNLYLSAADGLGNVNIINASSSGKATITNRYFTNIRFWITSGAVFNNVTFYPMLNEGSTALPYEPYFEGLRDTAVSELVSEGANLLPFPYKDKSKTEKGVTFTVNNDGTITVNGTATGDGMFSFFDGKMPVNGTYKLSGIKNTSNTSTKGWYAQIYLDGKSQDIAYTSNTYNLQGTITRIVLFHKTGAVFDNVVIEPMLNYGSTIAPYKPYRAEAVDTFPIVEEIQALDGYGRGVEGYPNYIDFDRKVYRQNSGTYIASGEETQAYLKGQNAAGNNVYIIQNMFDFLYANQTPMLCDKYTYKGTQMAKNVISASDAVGAFYAYFDSGQSALNYLYCVSSASTVEEFVTELTGARFDYALAEPIETDISAYLGNDSFIEVEGGGSIRAINEYNNPAPTSITYLLKEGSI